MMQRSGSGASILQLAAQNAKARAVQGRPLLLMTLTAKLRW
jgi:hypothetical protein